MNIEMTYAEWLKKINRMVKCYKIYSYRENKDFFQKYTEKIHTPNDLFSIIDEFDGDEKVAILVAGAIGSGKSTFMHNLLEQGCIDDYIILSPDIYLYSFYPHFDYLMAYNNTKKVINECYSKCQVNKMPFIVELVPAKDDKINFIRDLKSNHFFIICFFIRTKSIEYNFARINKRVDEGAFSIPDEKMISRFLNSNQNIETLKKLSDIFFLINTSSELPIIEESKQ